ncbi:MAG: RagB/SusD family nutrient uptake outer membrane protein [Prevotellaceae bacterium]|jgi:hypothetical protein|nr:RagB/SusD family nutrient uptake outer membrane protein [Prevotellaceae bacterium]
MRKYFTFTVSIAVSLLLSTCNVLDKEPYDSISEELVWANAGMANLYLNELYRQTLPSFGATETSSMSDETRGENDYIYGKLTEESVGDFSNETYAKIRKINILLERIDGGGIPEQTDIDVIKGQAYFLRAWIYWNLVNLYGGVPLVLHTQNMSTSGEVTEEIKVKRNKTSECIDSIVRDLDLAAKCLAILPNQTTRWTDADYGRVTRGAAMALKGRVLLFWASPQFNPQNKPERWERAYEANKAAIDTLRKDGYELHPSFTELFTDCKEQTSEAIFVRVYDAAIAGSYYHSYDNGARPQYEGIGGGATNNPSWELVKAFPRSDGYLWGESPTYDGSDTVRSKRRYWRNRDPRFYATIAYNGCTWPLSGQPDYKIWTYLYRVTSGSTVSLVSTEGNVHTYTGFYCRKFVNPKILKGSVDKVGTDWMEIRFAEVALNLAECANEVDKRSEAYDNIELIRKRAWSGSNITSYMGNISASMSKDAMREAIMRERQVELAFENKRFWDLRRRNMFMSDLGSIKALNGTVRNRYIEELNLSITTESGFKNIRNTTNFDGDDNSYYNSYFYNTSTPAREDPLDTKQAINYQQPKYNFYAIQKTNLDKNPNLQQTTGWSEGTFDPLAE